MKKTKLQHVDPPSQFYLTCRRRIYDFLRDQKNPSGRADYRMKIKVATIISLWVVSYALMFTGWVSGSMLFLTQVIYQYSMFLMTIGVIHDAAHGALFKSNRLNRIFSYGFDLFGINSRIWIQNHVYSHHAAPNVPGEDSAIESFKLIRLDPSVPWRPWHRYQHFYMFPLYGLVTLFQSFFLEWVSLAQQVVGFRDLSGAKKRRMFEIILGKCFIIVTSLVLPLLYVTAPASQIIAAFFVGHFLSGISLGVIFQTTHLADKNVFIPLNEKGQIPGSFDLHILKTTTNFSVDNPVMTWIAGGLNHHVTHHLFPEVSQIYLPEMTRIVRQVAIEQGLPYHEQGTVAAVVSHLKMLRRLGQP